MLLWQWQFSSWFPLRNNHLLLSILPRYLKWSTSFSPLLFTFICNDLLLLDTLIDLHASVSQSIHHILWAYQLILILNISVWGEETQRLSSVWKVANMVENRKNVNQTRWVKTSKIKLIVLLLRKRFYILNMCFLL